MVRSTGVAVATLFCAKKTPSIMKEVLYMNQIMIVMGITGAVVGTVIGEQITKMNKLEREIKETADKIKAAKEAMKW